MMVRISRRGEMIPGSAISCKTTILCFFTIYRHCPIAYAHVGHHEISLIQFEGGIPGMIYSLPEITEKKTVDIEEQICLCSYETLKANGAL